MVRSIASIYVIGLAGVGNEDMTNLCYSLSRPQATGFQTNTTSLTTLNDIEGPYRLFQSFALLEQSLSVSAGSKVSSRTPLVPHRRRCPSGTSACFWSFQEFTTMASIMQFKRITRQDTSDVPFDTEIRSETGEPDQEFLTVAAKPTEVELNPRSWPLYKRVLCTVLVTSVGFIVSWAGSITSAIAKNASHDFGVSETVESLAAGLYFVGFGLGSLVAGPVSETLGRNAIYVVAMCVLQCLPSFLDSSSTP